MIPEDYNAFADIFRASADRLIHQQLVDLYVWANSNPLYIQPDGKQLAAARDWADRVEESGNALKILKVIADLSRH